MKPVRSTMSALVFAIAAGCLTDVIADDCSPAKGATEASPFVIAFETSGDGTVLTPVAYRVSDGKLGARLTADDKEWIKGALAVSGKHCGGMAIAVNRFYNHELFYTIEIFPGVFIKIPIIHPHPH